MESTASLALNIVLAFGVIAVAGGTLALLQSAPATIALGMVMAVGGSCFCTFMAERFRLLGNILLPMGALTAAGGIIFSTEGSVRGFALVTGLFLVGAVVARSGLLASLAVFALLSVLGGATGYEHACYFLEIQHPSLTVGVFSLLAAAAYFGSLYQPPAYARLAIIASRTAVVVANFGFWVCSLWGDHFDESGQYGSEWFFITGWAVAIIVAGIWGAWCGLRWLVNTCATFGAIHLYTQWFEHFSASPGSVILAGLFAIAAAYALIAYNRRARGRQQPAV